MSGILYRWWYAISEVISVSTPHVRRWYSQQIASFYTWASVYTCRDTLEEARPEEPLRFRQLHSHLSYNTTDEYTAGVRYRDFSATATLQLISASFNDEIDRELDDINILLLSLLAGHFQPASRHMFSYFQYIATGQAVGFVLHITTQSHRQHTPP